MGKLSDGKKIMKNEGKSDEKVMSGSRRLCARQSKRLNGRELKPNRTDEKSKLSNVLLETILKEVKTLSMEVVEFERRAQDRYCSLITENRRLQKKVEKLSTEVAEINKNISKAPKGIEGEKSLSNTLRVDASSMLELEPEVNGAFDDTDDEEKLDEEVCGRNSNFNVSEANNKTRKKRAAANKREGDYANMLKQNISFHEPKKIASEASKFQGKKGKLLKKGSDDGSDSDESNDDIKVEGGISQWKLFKHLQIKPQKTGLPKPNAIRSGGGRNVHFTDEWKQYATAIYPIDPSRYWNLAQADYDRLIPDADLELYAKNPDKTEKDHLVRSIYDWFRSQHRIAQLRVVLNDCDSATDLDSLWDVYVKEMKRRGWPIYGKRLRKSEVSIAKQKILEDFVDCNIQLF